MAPGWGLSCYDGSSQNIKALGYDVAIGSDGRPVDPKNPNAKRLRS